MIPLAGCSILALAVVLERAWTCVLRDSNYLTGSAPPPSDPLRHEKCLLLDWFQSEFDSRGATR